MKRHEAMEWANRFTFREAQRMIPLMQVQVSTMCGNGSLGDFAARQPADFYIDARVGRLPYPRKTIYRNVEMLAALMVRCKMNPSDGPKRQLIYS